MDFNRPISRRSLRRTLFSRRRGAGLYAVTQLRVTSVHLVRRCDLSDKNRRDLGESNCSRDQLDTADANECLAREPRAAFKNDTGDRTLGEAAACQQTSVILFAEAPLPLFPCRTARRASTDPEFIKTRRENGSQPPDRDQSRPKLANKRLAIC